MSEIKKVSAQKAIFNMCKSCIYDPLAGGSWREQVEQCKISRCELYEHRPRSNAHKKEQREIYLASLTPEQLAEEQAKNMKAAQALSSSRKLAVQTAEC